ncbi:unnamed protein product [Rangifer tarandus platyrhynchus]|uniref:Uncharacterized protein n=2 Tax=Rangifer tarandus platyrhynchus TaxID=3082113 RepID=A0AC59YQL1_RANTA|nr:unnamed protein product [Rangifer tarandus platyrhynchus]
MRAGGASAEVALVVLEVEIAVVMLTWVVLTNEVGDINEHLGQKQPHSHLPSRYSGLSVRLCGDCQASLPTSKPPLLFTHPPSPEGIRAGGQCQGHSLLQEITSDTGRQRVAQISSCPPVGTGCSSHRSFRDDSAAAQTSRRPCVDLRDCALSCLTPPVLAASLSHRTSRRNDSTAKCVSVGCVPPFSFTPGLAPGKLTSPWDLAEGVPRVDTVHSEKPEEAGRTRRVQQRGWGGTMPPWVWK